MDFTGAVFVGVSGEGVCHDCFTVPVYELVWEDVLATAYVEGEGSGRFRVVLCDLHVRTWRASVPEHLRDAYAVRSLTERGN